MTVLRKIISLPTNHIFHGKICTNYLPARFVSKMAKPSVLITREVNKEAMDILEESCNVSVWKENSPIPRSNLIENIKGKQALFCMLTDRIDKDILDASPDLKVVATMSAGFDHLDVKEITSRGIKIGYTPDTLTDATAELTVALLLATSRQLFPANQAAKTGEWAAWSPFWMCGRGLANSTVGIVGLGRIGLEVAKRIKAFNPSRILYTSRTVKAEAKVVGGEKVTFDELLEQSDFVVCTCNLSPETANMFNEQAFNKMKPDAIFVNTSRGGVVDQTALVNCLKNNRIFGAGLDVMVPEPLPLDHPLFGLKNCLILPHIGSATTETRKDMGILTARNIVAGLNDKPLPAQLN